jgi:hypothetical protein
MHLILKLCRSNDWQSPNRLLATNPDRLACCIAQRPSANGFSQSLGQPNALSAGNFSRLSTSLVNSRRRRRTLDPLGL